MLANTLNVFITKQEQWFHEKNNFVKIFISTYLSITLIKQVDLPRFKKLYLQKN